MSKARNQNCETDQNPDLPRKDERQIDQTHTDLRSKSTAISMDSSSPAPAAKLPTPPYHHSPAVEEEEAATPPPKQTGRGSPLPSPQQQSGCLLHELLLLSPSPSSRRNRSRLRVVVGTGVDSSLEMAGMGSRRRRRGTGEQRAALAGASPRNAGRARRRLEKEVDLDEDAARKARRRKSTRAAPKAASVVVSGKVAAAAEKEKEENMSLALVPALTDAIHITGTDALEQSGWEDLWGKIVDLVMWKDVARSALWFGLGSVFFISCSFSGEITFSPISVFCHLGVMILVLAFFKNFMSQRQPMERGGNFQLTEEDVLRAARVVLPIANLMISMAQVIFSGDPSTTLKVLPVLLFGAKYGSLVTVWRLLATGFFTSFTLPKHYICNSNQIHSTIEILRDQMQEAWTSCPRKKLVAATTVTMCWNLFSVKTRFMAAFVLGVILRYNHQYRNLDVTRGAESCQDRQEQEMQIEH